MSDLCQWHRILQVRLTCWLMHAPAHDVILMLLHKCEHRTRILLKRETVDVRASAEIRFLDQPQPVHGTMRFCSGTERGIKDSSVLKHTSTGNNTNTHISTSRILFRTFQGFCYLLSTLSIGSTFHYPAELLYS